MPAYRNSIFPAFSYGLLGCVVAACTVRGGDGTGNGLHGTPGGVHLSNAREIGAHGPRSGRGGESAPDVDTVFPPAPLLIGSKIVSGSVTQGGTATYQIVLINIGSGDQPDNPGNELIDVLPAGLSLVSASATSGTAVATPGTNTVTWNGAIVASDDVTITIVATITAPAGTAIPDQATFFYDSQATGTNDASSSTDALP